jgi:hypothetical protein|tara:strand:+ start:371 stop:739 length:369 start_codon:yes stop_codon:yes gene_type:complete
MEFRFYDAQYVRFVMNLSLATVHFLGAKCCIFIILIGVNRRFYTVDRTEFRKDSMALTVVVRLFANLWSPGYQKYSLRARVCWLKLTLNFQAKFHMSFIILLVNSTYVVSSFSTVKGSYGFS